MAAVVGPVEGGWVLTLCTPGTWPCSRLIYDLHGYSLKWIRVLVEECPCLIPWSLTIA